MAVVTMHATSFPPCSIVSLVYSTPLGITWAACTRTGNSIANVNVTRQRISLLGRLNDGGQSLRRPWTASALAKSRRIRHPQDLKGEKPDQGVWILQARHAGAAASSAALMAAI